VRAVIDILQSQFIGEKPEDTDKAFRYSEESEQRSTTGKEVEQVGSMIKLRPSNSDVNLEQLGIQGYNN